jgi:negative regulator of flagellin synthesis FlgM
MTMVDPARFGAVQPVTPVRPRDTIATQTQRSAAQTPSQQTSLPQLLNMVAELATHGPPVDHAKIAQLRQAIAFGSYRADPDAIAEALIGFGR